MSISAYSPQIYQPKIPKYNTSLEGVQKILDLKNQLYEQNYQKIQGLKSQSLGINFINEEGKGEIQKVQKNITDYFKNNNINDYDIGNAQIANQYINQFKTLEANKPLQELYAIDKQLQNDLSSVSSLRTDKDRAKKGYNPLNDNVFQLRLQDYAKESASSAVAKGATSFKYVPYTDPNLVYKSVLSSIPTVKYDKIDPQTGLMVTVTGKDPKDIYSALQESSNGLHEQLGLSGELEVRQMLASGKTNREIFEATIAPRYAPIIEQYTEGIKAIDIKIKQAIIDKTPDEVEKYKGQRKDYEDRLTKIRQNANPASIEGKTKSQFISLYSEIAKDQTMQNVSNAFGQLNETLNMPYYLSQIQQKQFTQKLAFEMSKPAKEKKEKEETVVPGVPDVTGVGLGSNVLTYDAFNKQNQEIETNASEIYKNKDDIIAAMKSQNYENSSNIYAKALNKFMSHTEIVDNGQKMTQDEKAIMFKSILDDLRKPDAKYNVPGTLRRDIYMEIKPSWDYHNTYNKVFNNAALEYNRKVGVNTNVARMLSKEEYDKSNTTKGVTYEKYKQELSLLAQQKMKSNYASSTQIIENPKFGVRDIPKDVRDAEGLKYQSAVREINNNIITSIVTLDETDQTQLTDLTNITKSITKSPGGYTIQFIDNNTTSKTVNDEDEQVTVTSKVEKGVIVFKKEVKWIDENGDMQSSLKVPTNAKSVFLPSQLQDPNTHLKNISLMNATANDPLRYSVQDYDLIGYSSNGEIKFQSKKLHEQFPEMTSEALTSALSSNIGSYETLFEKLVTNIKANQAAAAEAAKKAAAKQ